MKFRKIIVFIIAVAISFLGATYRWGDSAHSIGLIKADGGRAMHPASLESGGDEYMLIATATVLPPYRGNARVVLEGEPEIDYEIYFSKPVVDMRFSDWPEFIDNTLYGLKPMDRLALWVKMHPPKVDPVCGMTYKDGFKVDSYHGRNYVFCSDLCSAAFKETPWLYSGNGGLKGKYTLAFYDTKTGNSVLNVPIEFKGKGDMANAGAHHH